MTERKASDGVLCARWVREQTGLTPGERCLLYTLATYVRGRVCWPSVRTLAVALEVDERSVRRLVSSLEAKGLLRRVRGGSEGGPKGRGNVYEVPWSLSTGRTVASGLRAVGGGPRRPVGEDRGVRWGRTVVSSELEEELDTELSGAPLVVTDVADARRARGVAL